MRNEAQAWTPQMFRLFLLVGILGMGQAAAQTGSEGRAMWQAATIRWEPAPGVPMAGMQQAVLLGDPSNSGRYIIRLRLPAGYSLPPHVYDKTREVTVLSGVLRFSYGDKYQPEGLTNLPSGSFYVEPANVPAFLEVKEPVELQITGEGPTRPPRLVVEQR
jgi:Domain of unknown function (DUF4437)